MKKSLVIGISLLLLASTPSLAKSQGVMTRTQVEESEPQGNTIRNKVVTKNAGEDSQLMVNTQESLQDNEDATKSGKRSAVARQNMSIVAQEVERLLEFKEDSKGIGTKVREIARAQSSAQEKIKEGLDKLDSRGSIMRALIGVNRKSLKDLSQQIEQNQLRVEELQELKNQVFNQADQTQIEEAIQALLEQNTALSEQVQNEGKVRGMFGWLVNIFAN